MTPSAPTAKALRRLAALASASALALLAACTPTQRAFSSGDVQKAAQIAMAADFSRAGDNDLAPMCKALQQTGRFDRYDACAAEMRTRMTRNDGHLAISDTPGGASWRDGLSFSANWSTASIEMMEAEAALGRGQADKAYRHAETALAAAETGTFMLLDDGDPDIDMDEAQTLALIDARRVLGMLEARRGDIAAADARIAALEAMQVGDLMDLNDKAGLRARAVAQIHLAARRPQQARAALDGVGAGAEVARVLSQLNPLMIAGSIVTGVSTEGMWFQQEQQEKLTLGIADLEAGNMDAAKASFDAILSDRRVEGDADVLWRALHGRARIALARGDRAGAIPDLSRAAEVVAAQRRSLAGEEARLTFGGGDHADLHADLIGALVDTGRAPEALAWAERAKARALVDLLAGKRSFAAAGPGADAALARYEAEVEAARARAAEAGVPLAEAVAPARAALEEGAPRLAPLIAAPALTAADLTRQVPRGEAALVYWRRGSDLFGFAVKDGRVTARRLSAAGLDAEADALLSSVWQSRSGSGWKTPARALHARLVAPFAEAASAKRLWIVPHGFLHYLPWATLSGADGPLAATHEAAVLPSLSTLGYLGGARGDGALVLGNPDIRRPEGPLPGAEAEARAVAMRLGAGAPLLRGAATEAAVRARAPRAGVLHLASHGVFDAADPLNSALLLAPGGGQDGTLTASEIYDLPLSARLVTLSACETGLGDVRSGDDVVGLTRGFLFAGADAVTASLWKVNDAATRALMERFYAEGAAQDPRGALARAQRAVAGDPRFAHPHYWAAFQVWGAPG
ncbi:CHAT domain-containing protein [Rhodovulum sp. DZ06]|uniref:CHAT domain-containing protein n=1 Tax=Rhodovulum sp. DZ06 TaxID=3425126 RepID=UPI003D32F713